MVNNILYKLKLVSYNVHDTFQNMLLYILILEQCFSRAQTTLDQMKITLPGGKIVSMEEAVTEEVLDDVETSNIYSPQVDIFQGKYSSLD